MQEHMDRKRHIRGLQTRNPEFGRTTPELPCAHFPNCAGCALIGRPYGEQLVWKWERVRAALAAVPILSGTAVAHVVGSPRAFGYRNQAKLVARRAGRGLLLGIYRPGTHQVVDIRQCPVHHPLINSTLERVAAILEGSGISVYDERTQSGALRYVVLRVGVWSKTVQIILVTHEAVLQRDLVRALEGLPRVVSVVHNRNVSTGNAVFGPRFVSLTKQDALIERVGAFKLKTHAGAFLQANIQVARRIYEYATVQAGLTEESRAIDLYCGVGALTFHLAARAKFVAGVEASAIAVGDAKENIRINGCHNARFYAGEAGQFLSESALATAPVDVITLNPPRKGTDPLTRERITALMPRRIIYISCNPDTLVRDLEWFVHKEYRVVALQPFDLMPQTDHVECVATLEREGGNNRSDQRG